MQDTDERDPEGISDWRLQLLLSMTADPPNRTGLRHLRRAAACWRLGDRDRAGLHVALSGTMAQHAANRLNLADRMAKAGVSPEAILRALRIGGDLEARKQYHPDQPRDPAGSPASGRWTASSVTGAATPGPPSNARPSPTPRHPPNNTPAQTRSDAQRLLTSDTTIGNLSIRYETGALRGQELQAAERVSSGVGDSGGVSYGAFQLCSALDKGQQVMALLRSP